MLLGSNHSRLKQALTTSQHLARRRVLPPLPRFFLLAGLCVACTVTLVSSYDETTDRDVTALHKTVGGLLDQLDRNPVPDYPSLKKTYDGIRGDLGATHLRNELRPNNTITVKQLDILRDQLKKLEELHQAGTFNQAMVGPTREILDQTFRAVLKLELEKKALNKTQ